MMVLTEYMGTLVIIYCTKHFQVDDYFIKLLTLYAFCAW